MGRRPYPNQALVPPCRHLSARRSNAGPGGHHPILEMQIGPIRHVVDSRNRAARSFSRELLVRETGFSLPPSPTSPTIQDVYRWLASDSRRNSLIVDDIIGVIEAGRSPIVLTERRDHLEFFALELSKAVRNVIVLQGGMTEKTRRESVRTTGGHAA